MEAEKTKEPGHAFAWAVLIITYIFSVAAAMFWFSTTSVTDGFIMQYIMPVPELQAATNTNVGLLMTDVSIAAFVAAVFCFFFQDRLGIKTVMVIGALCTLAGCLVAAFSGADWTMLRISRYIGGLGIGCAATSATVAISLWFGHKQRGLAMAIWGTWVPVAMIINYVILRPFALTGMVVPDMPGGMALGSDGHPMMGEFGPMFTTSAPNIHILYWVGAVFALVALVLLAVVYKDPPRDLSAVSAERSSMREGLRYILKRPVIALLLCMLFYTYTSNCFTSFNVAFFTGDPASTMGGLGMDQTTAGLVAVAASACGIIAPLFGFINDRITQPRKHLMIVVAGITYCLACVFGFKQWGMPLFVAYIVFMVLSNAIIVASVRPLLPALVHRGGVTAVTLGLALITFLEFFGQIFGTIFGAVADASGYATASFVAALPAAVCLIICALLVKPGKTEIKE